MTYILKFFFFNIHLMRHPKANHQDILGVKVNILLSSKKKKRKRNFYKAYILWKDRLDGIESTSLLYKKKHFPFHFFYINRCTLRKHVAFFKTHKEFLLNIILIFLF